MKPTVPAWAGPVRLRILRPGEDTPGTARETVGTMSVSGLGEADGASAAARKSAVLRKRYPEGTSDKRKRPAKQLRLVGAVPYDTEKLSERLLSD